MTDSIFVDTNILVYAHDVTAGAKHKRAQELLLELWESKAGCLSIQVMQEFYVTVTHKVTKPMEVITAMEIIRDLSYWRVHEPVPDDVIKAIKLHQQYLIAFWDAMVLQSAAQLGCSMIWSEDLNPGQVYEGVRLLNPFL
jgi:predicted nucleic acid-binding protein